MIGDVHTLPHKTRKLVGALDTLNVITGAPDARGLKLWDNRCLRIPPCGVKDTSCAWILNEFQWHQNEDQQKLIH